MDENPYRAPVNDGSRTKRAKYPQPLLHWPPTLLEWIVIGLVVLAIAALLIPDLDEG
jgi:hypothetical protein